MSDEIEDRLAAIEAHPDPHTDDDLYWFVVGADVKADVRWLITTVRQLRETLQIMFAAAEARDAEAIDPFPLVTRMEKELED